MSIHYGKKICGECQRGLSVSNFYRDRQTADGYDVLCKGCRAKHPMILHPAISAPAKKGCKPCSKCQEILSLEDFHRNKYSPDGRHTQCVGCRTVYHRRKSSLVDVGEESVIYRNTCEICGVKARPELRLSVDHDHTTGKVRGILCRRCNFGIAYFHDSPSLMESAKNYLEKGQSVNA